MFEERAKEQKVSSQFRQKTKHNISDIKKYVEYHKIIQNSRIEDIENLWSDVRKLVTKTMSLSVCQQDQQYIENTLCEMIDNFDTIKCTKKILEDTKKYEKHLKRAEDNSEESH